MTKVIKAVEAQMDDFDGVQLVTVMWSFGKLQVNPGAAVVHRICDRLAVMLVDLSPQVRRCHQSCRGRTVVAFPA